METLGNYELSAAMTNQNAGYSIWAFGTKDDKKYFIKQFVEYKYPVNDTVSSPDRIAKKRKQCERFEQRKRAIYRAINDNSDGNAVRVEEFFRIGPRYYVAMPKISAESLSYAQVSQLPMVEIRRLCAIIAHSVASLHKGKFVHADLKPDNILFTRTNYGRLSAKIIDFDSGFLESSPPGPGETIVGDFHYFSPEACMSIWGETVPLTCKMDVFALGVLFHQYFSGQLPGFNTEQSTYSGEAAARGEILAVSANLPRDIQELLTDMLQPDPSKRPTALEVFCKLRGIPVPVEMPVEKEAKKQPEKPVIRREDPPKKAPDRDPTVTSSKLFFHPGDL